MHIVLSSLDKDAIILLMTSVDYVDYSHTLTSVSFSLEEVGRTDNLRS